MNVFVKRKVKEEEFLKRKKYQNEINQNRRIK